MKKLMTLVLAVCMLFAAVTAFADAPVLQDEKAPALVGKVTADGSIVYATAYDAAGNATQITDKKLVTLTDISARKADDAVMQAAAKSGDFAAQNIVAVEKFALAVEGADVVEAIFQLQDWQEVTAAFVTTDGATWTACEITVNGDGTVTVKTVPGVLVFASVPAPAEEVPAIDEIVENSNFTSSIAAKPAPGVAGASIDDGNGNIVKNPIVGTELVITPVSARQFVKDIAIYDNLNGAFKAILQAASLADLGIADAQTMIVRDLFEVTLYGDSLYAGSFKLKVVFEADAPDAVAVNGANGWKVIPAENIVDNGDGTATITLSELGTVAFLVDVVGGNAVTSPAT